MTNRNIPWDLIVAKLKNTISEEQEQQLAQWLDEEHNMEVYSELSKLWQTLHSEYSSYTPDLEANWQKLSQRITSGQEEDYNTLPKRRFTLSTKILLSIASLIAIMLLSIPVMRYISGQQSDSFTHTYSSLQGKSRILLPDNTDIWMHNNSSITYDSSFGKKDRTVKLQGEAYFSVAHDNKVPFIVDIDGMYITVHGTQFNVRAADSSDVYISLFEGSISLKVADNNYYILPGQIAKYNKVNNRLTINEGNVELEKCWTQDEIVFRDKDLAHICQFLSRWYGIEIGVDPAIAHEYMYTFTLRNESLEEIMRIMQRINSIDYKFSEDNVLTIKKKLK